MPTVLTNWTNKHTRFFLAVVVAAYLSLFLPFWQPVILALLFACACAPLIGSLRQRFHSKRSRIAYIIMAATFTVSLLMIGFVLIELYTRIEDAVGSPENLTAAGDKLTHLRDQFIAWAQQKSYLSHFDVSERFARMLSSVTETVKRVGLAIAPKLLGLAPALLLNIFIFTLSFGAFLLILPSIWKGLARLLDLSLEAQGKFREFEKICMLSVGSVIITATVQATLASIGAAIAGFHAIGLIFAVTLLFATIPVLGAGLIPTVLAIMSYAQGDISGAVIMLVTMLVVGSIDNVLRAVLFSRAAESNPVISLITLLGGIAIFGFPGLFIAPILEQMVMKYCFDTNHRSDSVRNGESQAAGGVPA